MIVETPFRNDNPVQQFESKLQLIRDRVGSVALGYHTGLYMVGRPGTSKTHTVRQELERLEEPNVYRNARMTAWGLFCFLAEHPEHVCVLDDITSLFKNDQAMQTLLAALDGKPGEPRFVTYKSKDKDEKFHFTGAVIAISNVPLRCDPLARALGSRVVVLEHEPSDNEIADFILQLASNGYGDLSPEECIDVAQFVIAETRQFDLRLDLRHVNKAWQDFRQYRDQRSRTHWRDLVRTSLMKIASEPVVPMSKRAEIEEELRRVRESMQKFPDDTEAQMAFTGLKKSTHYNRRKQVTAEDRAA